MGLFRFFARTKAPAPVPLVPGPGERLVVFSGLRMH